MAGDWIKFEKATLDKPEVFEMAEMLDVDPDAVVGKLLRVWNWFDDQSHDGNANVTVRALLDRYAGVTGFTQAMESVGWLDIEGRTMSLPNFDRHNGQTAKNRALTAKRVNKSRSKSNATCNGESVTPIVTSSLPEKRREEKSKVLDKSNTKGGADNESPLPFDSEEFKDTWSEWLTYLKQKRKTPTKITITKQHKQLSKLTETDAINTINKSIQNGWQGLFPDEQRNGKHSSHSGQANRSSAGHSTGAGDGINVPIL